MKRVCILALLVSAGLLSMAWAQQPAAVAGSRSTVVVPPLVNFSGVLIDVNGKPLTGVVGVTFALYKDSQGGAPLWLETQNVYPDKTGHYTVMLGSSRSTGIPAQIFAGAEARWLGVQPQGQAEQPRVSLLSVPYAMKAADAQTVGGLPASAFVLAAPGGISASTSSSSTVGTAGTAPNLAGTGTQYYVPLWTDNAGTLGNSVLYQSGTGSTAKVGINTTTPSTPLDVKGAGTIRGMLSLPASGTATATKGANSQALAFAASAFNSGTSTAVKQTFQWQAQPVGNNTANATGSLHLLFGQGSSKPSETGLHIASNGRITFAPGQTFPGTGNGTVSSVALTAPSTEFLVTGSPVTGSGTLGLGWLVAPDPNNTPNAIVKRDSSGSFSAGAINAATSFNLGGSLFAFGSYATQNAFVGFAGNTTTTGLSNTASGYRALYAKTTGNYNTASGSYSLNSNTTGYDNTASGAGALYANGGGYYNTASGAWALFSNTAGSDNTATGGQALYSNTLGGANTATGYQALYSSTTGSQNTATGDNALYSSTTGGANTASGYEVLYSNTIGGANTASGYQALYHNTTGSYNTASGLWALYHNTTGNYNTASGYQALYYNTAGNYNTAVGENALYSNSTGSYLTCVGYDCSAAAANLTNATAIGAHAVVGESNALVLGGTGESAVKVGIGTTTPSNILTIGRGLGHPLSDSWETYSSRRWKTNIETLHGALGKVEQLRGVSYDLKDSGKHEIGVIAEEVGAVIPEVVTWEKNGKDAQAVDYGRLTALLIEATKEQQTLIHQQQQQIRVQQAQIKAQQTQNKLQQAQIARLSLQVKAIQASLNINGRTSSEVRTVKAQVSMMHQ